MAERDGDLELKLVKRILAIGVVGLTPLSASAESYTVGVVPQFEPEKLAGIWAPILEQVSAITGDTYELVGSTNIPEFETDFLRGNFDFAYMNPYHLVMANRAQGYLPLINDGSRMLSGVLVAAKDSGVETVADLEGKTIAYPAPNALGASLLMRAELERKFALNYSARYVSTHSSAYLNVVLGEAGAAGGVRSTLNETPAEIRDQLVVIFETEKLPPHPIAAHPRVSKEAQAAFTQAFLQLAADPETNALLVPIPMTQASETSLDDFEIVKQLGLDSYVISSGN